MSIQPAKGWPRAPQTVVVALLLYLTLRPPPLFDVRLTPYKSLSQGLLYPKSEVVFSRWNAFSRVDILRSDGIRSAPGLSFAYSGRLPPQLGLLVDGDNLVPITRPTQPAFTRHLPLALSFRLRPAARVLILEPGGGLAVLAAFQAAPPARTVTVVHSNPTVVEALRTQFASFNGHLYRDPRVSVIIDEPRSFLRRTTQQFDLIILPLTDGFRPVTAGAYTLSEDYRYTVEAMADALGHLAPDGLLITERWLQLPPSESLRLWGTIITALHQTGRTDAANHVAALRSLQTSLILAGHAPLTAKDVDVVQSFAAAQQFDLVWLPGLRSDALNRFSLVPDEPYHRTFAGLLATDKPATFYAAYDFAVAPPTDDHPFFFHFFKWRQTPQILQELGTSWQPFGGSGYLILAALLALVMALSAGLILLPLAGRSALSHGGRKTPAFLLYFGLLGLGFLFVEIPLLQRFILYLGQPAYAFAAVISTLLVAAGTGSYFLSGRLALRVTLPGIAGFTLLYPLLLPPLFSATLHLPFAGRVAVTVAALFPLGTLLGIPFPRGLLLLGQTAPGLTPWAWAVNGCASVVSAVLAAIIALTWGFSVVLWGAALAYGLAGLFIGLAVRNYTGPVGKTLNPVTRG